MTDYKKYISALRKCAKEHENDITITGQTIVADLCRATANLLEELEQQPCEDVISRAEAIEICKSRGHDNSAHYISKLPTATPQEPCEDAINRQSAIDAFERFIHEFGIEDKPYNYGEMALSVQNVPPVTPQPKTGHWIEERNAYGEIEHWHCSNCYEDSGFTTTCAWDYCPNCGAKMKGAEE